ncbi:unnamed protein product [Paramecium sonneborni]|uniref:Uncharacterized protein n=1 Tax=Paramecium sonneborni TaxID=65129 RepID=A0A8S1PV94_9CILI|nr:unnamed protein product [Paramecium sonneborni]
MKLLSQEQSESQQSNMEESQKSEEGTQSRNIDILGEKEQQSLNQLKFFDVQNFGFDHMIHMIGKVNGESSKENVGKVKKIKKFQLKVKCEGGKRKEKMNKKRILKEIAMEEILGLIGEL